MGLQPMWSPHGPCGDRSPCGGRAQQGLCCMWCVRQVMQWLGPVVAANHAVSAVGRSPLWGWPPPMRWSKSGRRPQPTRWPRWPRCGHRMGFGVRSPCGAQSRCDGRSPCGAAFGCRTGQGRRALAGTAALHPSLACGFSPYSSSPRRARNAPRPRRPPQQVYAVTRDLALCFCAAPPPNRRRAGSPGNSWRVWPWSPDGHRLRSGGLGPRR